MRLFFAGSDGQVPRDDLLHDLGARDRLVSYYLLRTAVTTQEAFDAIWSRFNVLLDSGGFTVRNAGAELSVEEYGAWLKQWQVPVAFNLDTLDVAETVANQEYLERYTDTYIIPIYHLPTWVAGHADLLAEYCTRPLIALAGIARQNVKKVDRDRFLQHCFSVTQDRVMVHGLGMTSPELVVKFPFYSVDSTSWLAYARYGRSSTMEDDNPLQHTINKTRHYLYRDRIEVPYWLSRAQHATEVWEARGVTWPERLSLPNGAVL